MYLRLILIWFFLIASHFVFAFQPPKNKTDLHQKEFFLPELYIPNRAASYSEVSKQLMNKAAIDSFLATYGEGAVYFDPRSGFPMSITASIPLIRGKGEVNANIVAELFHNFVIKNAAALGIDLKQMGLVKAVKVTDRLWHINIPQQVNSIPVRWSRYVAVINSGNIVLQGAATWGNVKIDTSPRINADQAIELGFQYAGGRLAKDLIWKEPALEIIPTAIGSGYGHRLTWVFGFQRAPENPRWEVLVDAHTSEILAFEDKNHYIDKQIKGGVYPLTNTEICPDNIRCGILQPNTPMPYADTGFAPPNDFTDSAGVFDYTSDTTTTNLSGPYVTMTDTCGAINETGAGDIDMAGTNGDHDCDTPTSGGNTAATRSGMYEVNKIFEEARGYLPNNPWVTGTQGPLQTNMNLFDTCNAFYSGSINFYRSGGGCRNTGEIAAVFDHEWGHGMDDHDSNQQLSSSSEGYADIASMFRLWASCVGYGFFETVNAGCGMTSDGSGFNQNEAQQGNPKCDLDCSGVRDADYLKIAGGTPLGASFMCTNCFSGSGPCGRQVHCAGTATREAAWNLVARELQNPPGVAVDANTAFIIGEKVFYQGSGNVGLWHNCTCPSASDGCNADGGYLNWLAADDDNGNLNDGTPHMEDIFAAFNTNGIACASPTPVNSGCAGAPTTAPIVNGAPGNNAVTLSWGSVVGAINYNVYRTEGFVTDGADKCAFGKALIGTTNSLTFTDTEAANGRAYSYVVMAEGSNDACFGPASNCTTVTPQPCAGSVSANKTSYSCNDTINITVVDSDLIGQPTQDVTANAGSDNETITLTETPPGSGIFTGSINTSGSAGSSGDGILNIVHGQVITITYSDQSFCGPPQDITTTATADCVAPTISNVQAINLTNDSATITWDTNELANSRVTYAIAPGPPSTNADDLNNYVFNHSIQADGLNQCTDYVYSVTSNDIAGNPITDDNAGSFYTFTTTGMGTLFIDDAESGIGNWISSGTPANNQWHVSTCDSQSGTQSFKAGPVACGAQYANNATETLTSNSTFEIQAGSRLQFMENYSTESGFDFCIVQISTNGATWTTIDTYSGNSNGWQPKDYDLSSYAGTGRKIRFLFTTDINTTSTGWFLDDIRITRPAPCAPALQHFSEAVTDDCSLGGAGDGDGAIDPGESGSMLMTAENFGLLPATNISAIVTTNTPGVAISNGITTFPDIPPESSAQANSPITFVVGPGVSCGTFIDFQVTYTSNEGKFGDNFTLIVGTEQNVILLSEDFSSGIPGTWTVINGGTGGGAAATWTTDNPGGRFIADPFLDPFAIVDSDFAGDSATQDEQLITPSLNTSACTTVDLTFSNQFRWYMFGDDEQADVDVSTDGGSNWINVLNMQDGDDGYPTPNIKTLDLSSLVSGQSEVKIRFHYQGGFDWWWAIDNIQVTCIGNPTCIICPVNCPALTLSPPTLPNGDVGVPYNQTITASGGSPPYAFAISSGELPQGLTLSSSGVISGTPTVQEIANFTITATDTAGCTGSMAYSITIGTPPACLFCDEFDDSTLDTNWTYIKNISDWFEDGTALIGTTSKKTQAHAIPIFGQGCTNCYAETMVRSAGGSFSKVWILFHVVDKNNLVELLMDESKDKWVLKHRINKTVVAKQKFLATIDPNTDYTVRLRYDGTNFITSINGIDQITLAPGGSVTGGSVGFKVKSTTGTFQRIEVN